MPIEHGADHDPPAAIMVGECRDQLNADHAVLVISLRRETIEAHEAIFNDITLLCIEIFSPRRSSVT